MFYQDVTRSVILGKGNEDREVDNLYKIQSIMMSIAELTFSDVLIFSVALINYLYL